MKSFSNFLYIFWSLTLVGSNKPKYKSVMSWQLLPSRLLINLSFLIWKKSTCGLNDKDKSQILSKSTVESENNLGFKTNRKYFTTPKFDSVLLILVVFNSSLTTCSVDLLSWLLVTFRLNLYDASNNLHSTICIS